MVQAFVFFVALVAVCSADGPTKPLSRGACTKVGMNTADAENACWYWVCLRDGYGRFKSVPTRCPLGSRISENYVSALTNPCTVNFNDVIGYSCSRKEQSGYGPPESPECHPMKCENGGVSTHESDKCWCICPKEWRGDFDCSKPTKDPTRLPPRSNICVDGKPLKDWCAASPCENGGTCYNNCNTHHCICPNSKDIDHYGKNCELPPN